MCNKLILLNYDMGHPNPSTFLGNVQWKIVNQFKTVISKSISHNDATVSVNLFEILEMLAGIYLTCPIKCFFPLISI